MYEVEWTKIQGEIQNNIHKYRDPTLLLYKKCTLLNYQLLARMHIIRRPHQYVKMKQASGKSDIVLKVQSACLPVYFFQTNASYDRTRPHSSLEQ